MSQTYSAKAGSDMNPEFTEGMAKYGITRAAVDYFHYEEYRYTNLRDALAQAKRTVDTAATGDTPGSR